MEEKRALEKDGERVGGGGGNLGTFGGEGNCRRMKGGQEGTGEGFGNVKSGEGEGEVGVKWKRRRQKCREVGGRKGEERVVRHHIPRSGRPARW